MSPPSKIYSPYPGVIYDEERGLCIAEENYNQDTVEKEKSAAIFDRSQLSMSTIYAEAFGPRHTRQAVSIFSHSPFEMSGWRAAASLSPLGIMGCSGDPDAEPVTGDPIASVRAIAGEQTLNSAPIAGNIDGVGLGSASGNVSAVAWSAFDATTISNSGTFAFVRSGEAGGSQATVSSDVSSRHLGTSVATLPNGESVVIFSHVTGDEEPSSLVAQRISPTGAPIGGEIDILPSEIRAEAPLGQVLALGDGFLVVYRENNVLSAKQYDRTGTLLGTRELGETGSSTFAIASGEGNRWGLAEISASNQIRVRTFDGTEPAGSDTTISSANIPAEADIALAMQDDGSMMAAWNTFEGSDQRIDGAYLGPSGQVVDGPFVLRRSGLANTLALASDHRGNYVFAWEEGGRINSFIFNGTRSPFAPADFSNISTGTQNANVLVSVSPEGILSFVYDKSSTSSGDVIHNITRRDYRITYE